MSDIVHSISVAASPSSIYPLVSRGTGFQAWWAEDVVVTADGAVDLGFFDRTTVYRLRPLSLEPGRQAAWQCETGKEWKGTTLVFQLQPQGATTVVRFSHAGWADASEFFVSCNTTWGELMFRLKAAAEGKAPGPLFRTGGLAY